MKSWKIGGSFAASMTSLQIFCTAIAQSGVWCDGFQTADVAADGGEERVPGPDRDREVEGRDDADDAERMPLLVHAVPRALGVHREAVEHARLADREVGDVDHLLDFAVALGLDLAHLEAHEAAEEVLLRAQRVAHQAHGFAAPRRRHVAPGGESRDALAITRS